MRTSLAHWLVTARAYILGVLGAVTFYAGFQALRLDYVTDAPRRPALSETVRRTSELYLKSFGPRTAVTVAVASSAERLSGEAGLAYLARLRAALDALPGAGPGPAEVTLSVNEHVAVVTKPLQQRAPLDPGAVSEHLAKAQFEEAGKGPFRIALLEPRGPEHERARDREPMLLMSAACLLMLAAGLLGYTGSFALTGAALAGTGAAAVWQLGLWRMLGATLTPDSLILMVLIAAMALGQAFPFCRAVLRSLANESDDPVSAAAVAWPRTAPYAAASLVAGGLAMCALLWLGIPSLSEHAAFAALGLCLAAPGMSIVFPLIVASIAIDRPVAVPGQTAAPSWRKPKKRRAGRHDAVHQRIREVIAILCAALALVAGLNAGARPKGPVSAGSDALDPALAWSQIADAAAVSPGSPLASIVILGRTPPGGCARFDVIDPIDRLSWSLRNVRGVVAVSDLPDAMRQVSVEVHQGDPRWSEPPRNPLAIVQSMAKVPEAARLYDAACSVLPITVSVAGPIDVSIARVIDTVRAFAAQNANAPITFSLAAGPLASAVSEHLAFSEHETAVFLSTLLAVSALAFLVLVDWRGAIALLLTFGLTLLAFGWTLAVRQVGLSADMAPLALLAALLPLDASIYLLSVAGTPATREAQHLVWRRALRANGRTLVIRAVTVAIAFGAWTLSPDYRQAATGLLAIVATVVTTAATLIVVPAVLGLIETALDWREAPTAKPKSA